MKTTELIQLLAELALKNYREGVRPDPFAATAAYAIATAAAAKFSPESAEAAAFVAVSTLIDLSKYAAQQAALATQASDLMKNFQVKEDGAADIKKIVSEFNKLVEQLAEVSFGVDASNIYDTAFPTRIPSTESESESDDSENYRFARHAASVNYTHGYACARAAYTHAVALAARYPVGAERDAAFKAAITKRLSADLLHEPIEPSFFMSIS